MFLATISDAAPMVMAESWASGAALMREWNRAIPVKERWMKFMVIDIRDRSSKWLVRDRLREGNIGSQTH